MPEQFSTRIYWRLWLPTPGNLIFTFLVIGVLFAGQNLRAEPNKEESGGGNASTNVINYQGYLTNGSGIPEDGVVDLTFSIWDAAVGGTQRWGIESHIDVPVSRGVFNVGLGSLMPGGIPVDTWDGDRYLEITVNGETLSPRELFTAVPIAHTVPDGAITSRHLKPAIEKVTIGPVAIPLTNELQTLITTEIQVEVPSTVWLIATCDCTVNDGAFIAAQVIVDNISPPPGAAQGIFLGNWPSGATNIRSTVSNNYVFDVNPGVHTFKLQARNYNGIGSATAENHTGFSYMIVGQD